MGKDRHVLLGSLLSVLLATPVFAQTDVSKNAAHCMVKNSSGQWVMNAAPEKAPCVNAGGKWMNGYPGLAMNDRTSHPCFQPRGQTTNPIQEGMTVSSHGRN